MGSQQLFLVLRARWKFAVRVFAGVVIFVVLVTLIMPKMYTGMASVVVQGKPDPLSAVAQQVQVPLMPSDILTQVDIIESEPVAVRAVKLLKLDEMPEFKQRWERHRRGDLVGWLADEMEKSITVAPSKESNVINISAKWADPKFAAALANAWAQAYIDTNIQLKVDSAKQYASWFNEQSRLLRADLDAKEKRLADFQNAAGIVATDDKLDVENARLQELSTELVTVQTQMQQSQSRQHQARSNVESLPEVLQSPVIASLKGELSQAEAKREDMAANYGKNYPDYKDIEAQIASLHQRIAQEAGRIAASLGGTAQVDVRREDDLKAALDAQKKRILQLKHEHDQVADLQNDVTMAQKNLDAVSERLAQSSLESQSQQTNVALLAPAVEPLYPSSPKLVLNALFGLFVGAVCGIGAALLREMADRRVREGDELVDLLGVPVLGRIPDAKVAPGRRLIGYGTPGTART
ncbi:MAG TPA: chain length determinant protein EpsF [Steroidobacteraceae bacterium]|jgi:chain length determinant protein EpsF|nr:chain length determinant protein EpsF [Steroidobacteraceae bacterium]